MGRTARTESLRPRFDSLKGRGTPRVVVAHQLFQTPEPLASRLVDLLDLQGGERVLEPSAGLGRIVRALQAKSVQVVAVDVSPDCCREVGAMCADFLDLLPSDLGMFDAVAMNPPFTMRSDIAHILHALEFLRPGGKLAALCLDGAQREDRLRPLCSTWERIPAGTFRAEGTDVPTVLLSIRREH